MPWTSALYTDAEYAKLYPKRIPPIEILIHPSISHYASVWYSAGTEGRKADKAHEIIERALRDDHQIMVRALELTHRAFDPTLHIRYCRTVSQFPGVYEFDINLCAPEPDRFFLGF